MSTMTSTRPTTERPLHPTPGLLSLIILTVVAGACAAAFTIWGGGLSGPAAMQGSARGTALVLLLAAIPLVVVSTMMVWQESTRAVLTEAGGLAYVVYNAVVMLFLTPLNHYFLLYVLTFSAATWALIVLLRRTRVATLHATAGLRGRAVAGYVVLVVVVNSLAWLGQAMRSLTDADPTTVLRGTGVMTNVIWVQDLAIWLPAAAAGAVWLWHRSPTGLLVTGGILVFWVLESVSIAVDQWIGSHADPSSSVVSSSMVAPFLVLALATLVVAAHLIRHVATSAATPE